MNRFLSALFVSGILFFVSTQTIFATKLEQQINIINQEFSTTETTSTPTNNSLGIFAFDPSKYNNETVYFEAVIKCTDCTGGNARAYVSLYEVNGSEQTYITTTATNYTLVRSESLTLTNSTYSPQIKVDATSGTASVIASRLIIIQDSTTITDTQTQIELGNTETFGVSTTAVALTNKKLFTYDKYKYSSITSATFAATVWGDNATYNASACLYTVGGVEVGCVTSATGSPAYPTPTSVSLVHNTTYEVRLKTNSGATPNVSISNAKLILTQSQAIGVTNFQLFHHLINTAKTDNDNTYTSQNYLNQFTPGSFDADKEYYYYQATMKTSAGTGNAQLIGASAIADSELSTTSTSYELKKSTDLATNMPGSNQNLDSQIKNANTDITTVSGSDLVIELTLAPTMTFTISGVGANTTNNGITTTETSTYNSLPFEHLTFNVPKYVAHKLYVSTNSYNGYTVTHKLLSALQGNYPGNYIDAFAGNSATWDSPQTWTTPTGTTKNVNTGWIGANTTDSRISGWESASEKFGPLSTVSHTVMRSDGPENGYTVYVTYAMEVNILQPADLYAANLAYTLLPTY